MFGNCCLCNEGLQPLMAEAWQPSGAHSSAACRQRRSKQMIVILAMYNRKHGLALSFECSMSGSETPSEWEGLLRRATLYSEETGTPFISIANTHCELRARERLRVNIRRSLNYCGNRYFYKRPKGHFRCRTSCAFTTEIHIVNTL